MDRPHSCHARALCPRYSFRGASTPEPASCGGPDVVGRREEGTDRRFQLVLRHTMPCPGCRCYKLNSSLWSATRLRTSVTLRESLPVTAPCLRVALDTGLKVPASNDVCVPSVNTKSSEISAHLHDSLRGLSRPAVSRHALGPR